MRIDRRALFTSATAATLLAATGVSAAARPKSGGQLRIALPRDGSDGVLVRGAVRSNLTEIAADGTLQGELATSWTSTGDGRLWRFELTKALDHTGQYVTSQNVASALRLGGFAADADGSAITIELDAPDPQLPLALAQSGAALDLPNGTGTYSVQRFEPGRGFLLTREAKAFKIGRAGWADTVEAVVIPDAHVRAEALLDGFVDVAVLPRPDSFRDRALFRYHPSAAEMVVAAGPHVGVPARIGAGPLDGGRLAERWWLA